ncbi:hypothetical protein [Hanstruepera ponticola]|uniref:hypothetical protein n=1 Tax=Hanstruepera ponticola TaxID=2042995 RepID=UPI000CF171EB|nr:hypothetical protein [Hanstruepera ponticola]
MNLESILEFLNSNEINYELHNPNYQLDYKAASLKKLIKNGLYFVNDSDNVPAIEDSIIITNKKTDSKNTLIIVENPQLVHYRICSMLVKLESAIIHPTAIIHPETTIGENVSIGPYCVLEKCEIGNNVTLKSHVVIYENTQIQESVFIDSHSCIGAAGLAWIWDEKGKRVKQPQIGNVLIESNCHIATDVTIVRGSLSETTLIGNGTVIAHGTKIGHGAQVGENVHMANNVSLAGNAVVGDRSFLGSASIISSNIFVPNNTIVGAGAMVNKNFSDEFTTLAGIPAKIIQSKNYLNKPKGVPSPHKK